ncbi:MAG: class I SAM-dependent methyltransferase [archaeon]|nr:class I SAM-dependent methyltransferase [archaeon]
MNNETCIVCNSKDFSPILSFDKPDKYESSLGVKEEDYSREWVKCNSCGFHYSVFSRDENLMDTLYTSLYRNNNSSWRTDSPEALFRKIISMPREQSDTKAKVEWIKSNIKKLEEDGFINFQDDFHHVLDIGGANGIFAYEFQDRQWISHVIDPDENGVFMRKYGIDFIQGYYNPSLLDKKVDLISMVYVLEHLRNPKSLLAEVKGNMNPDSLLYVEVPDAISFKHKPKEDDIFNSTHLWMFDPNTLSAVLNQTGFEPMCLNRVRTKRDNLALRILAAPK